jgi:hypothetical protein
VVVRCRKLTACVVIDIDIGTTSESESASAIVIGTITSDEGFFLKYMSRKRDAEMREKK